MTNESRGELLSDTGSDARMGRMASAVGVAEPFGGRTAERAARYERRFAAPMLAAALLVIPVELIEVSSLGGAWKTFGSVLNWLIWLAFLTELVVMLAVVPDRKQWIRANPLEFAIVVLTPPFLPASFAALRLFRLLRLLRLAVIVKEARRLISPDGVKFAAVVAAASALCGGEIFANAEDHSTWDGVYWAVTTMATVGYGDLAPHTVIGRIVAIGLMIVGISFFALVTGAIAQRFVATDVRSVEQTERQLVRHEDAARAEVLNELRDMSERLRELEQKIAQL